MVKPNYNSAVATFCYNIANDLPIQINDPDAVIRLVYVDDVVETIWDILTKNILRMYHLKFNRNIKSLLVSWLKQFVI